MNKTGIIAGALAIISISAMILVITPYFSILRQSSHHESVPVLAPEVQRGREIYVSLGCVYCHSQQPRNRNFGPDHLRGWGEQPDALDYLGQRPHQLGTSRTGPDLFNIGDRNPSIEWNLVHLYNPRLVVPWSIMPAYPFLFELKSQPEPSDYVLDLENIGHHSDVPVVATQDALDLVAYLRSLKQLRLTDAE